MNTGVSISEVEAAAQFMAELRAQGVWMESPEPNRLLVGPPELLDEKTVARARRAKPALLRIFTKRRTWSCVRCERFHFRLPTVCYWCRKAEGTFGRA